MNDEIFVSFYLVDAGGSGDFAGSASSGQIQPILACFGFERNHGEE